MLMISTNTILLAVVAVTFAVGVNKHYRKRVTAPTLAATPVLLSYYTDGVNIIAAEQGKIANMHYSAYLTVADNRTMQHDAGSQSLIYRVELPFSTKSHIVGIPKRTGAVQLDPAAEGSIMQRVQLEGDYQDYFTLYSEQGSGADTQYVLDPKAMIFTIDFCQSQSWEIVGNELYFIQTSGTVDGHDTTSMEQDVAVFVSNIRPALEAPNTAVDNPNNVPYGQDRRTDLVCPICKIALTNADHYFACPDGHGFLVNGQALVAIKRKTLKLPIVPAGSSVAHKSLTCPSCETAMVLVDFDGSQTVIDTCPNCPYRWLDGSDVIAIAR